MEPPTQISLRCSRIQEVQHQTTDLSTDLRSTDQIALRRTTVTNNQHQQAHSQQCHQIVCTMKDHESGCYPMRTIQTTVIDMTGLLDTQQQDRSREYYGPCQAYHSMTAHSIQFLSRDARVIFCFVFLSPGPRMHARSAK